MERKDRYKYLLYGDSILKGIVYDEAKRKYTILEESFPFILQNKLKGVIYNTSRFGNTLIKAADRLQKDVLKKDPDIVVVEFGGNDCDFNWEEVAKDPYADHKPRTDFNVFEKLLKDLLYTLERYGIVPVLMNLPPIDADRYFKWISKNSSAIGDKILTWLGTVTKIYWWQERYNSVIINVAKETGTKLIDVRSAFLRYPDYREFICADGIHPNNKGHKVIADKIVQYVKSGYDFLLTDQALASF